MIRKDRNAKGGGVLLAISNELDGYECDLSCTTESVYAVIHGQNQPPTLIGAFYWPPDHKIKYMRKALKELKTVIQSVQPSHIILGGDYNLHGIDWNAYSAPPGTAHRKQAKLLLNTMEELNLSQMITFPTRGRNTLDLLFTDAPTLITSTEGAPGLSDHETIIVKHQLKATINKKESREVPLYHKANWTSMREDCQLFSEEYLSSSPRERTVASNWSLIKSTLISLTKKHIPHKTIGSRFHLPYITQAIKRKIRQRQRVYNRYKKHRRKKDEKKCKSLRIEINRDLDAAYSDYINNLFESEEDKPGAMKKFIKSLRHNAA